MCGTGSNRQIGISKLRWRIAERRRNYSHQSHRPDLRREGESPEIANSQSELGANERGFVVSDAIPTKSRLVIYVYSIALTTLPEDKIFVIVPLRIESFFAQPKQRSSFGGTERLMM